MDEVIDALVPGGWGLAIGVGVGVALIMGSGVRPLAQQAIKGYLAASEGFRGPAGARKASRSVSGG